MFLYMHMCLYLHTRLVSTLLEHLQTTCTFVCGITLFCFGGIVVSKLKVGSNNVDLYYCTRYAKMLSATLEANSSCSSQYC